MSLRLICGPVGSGKTERAIEVFLDAQDGGGNPVFIAPSQPDARHFQRQILRAAGGGDSPGVLAGGKVTTFGGLCRELLEDPGSGGGIINANERFVILRAIIDLAGNLQDLAHSASHDGFVGALSDLIGELELLGFDAARMGNYLKPWANGNQWRQRLASVLYGLFERYEAVLEDHLLMDEEISRRRAMARLGDPEVDFAHKALVIHGFWDFTPFQHELIETLASSGHELLVTLPFVEGREAYRAPGQHLRRLGRLGDGAIEALEPRGSLARNPAIIHLVNSLFEPGAERVHAAGAVRKLTGAGLRGQAEAVAAEILNLFRDGHALDDIAVVCRSLGPDLFAVAAALEEFGVPCELSAPVPLALTAVGRTALALLDFAAGDRRRDSLFAYLRSPLSAYPVDRVDRFDLDCRLHGVEDADSLLWRWRCENREFPLEETGRLREAAGAGLEALGDELCRAIRGLLTRREFVVRASVDTLLGDMPALKCIEEICRAAGVAGRWAAELAPDGKPPLPANAGPERMFMRAIRQATFRAPAGNRRGCVRLLDPHRILNQKFDIVFVCGMLEKQFPVAGREDPFLSDSDRRELAESHGFELAQRKDQLDKERFLFLRTLSRAAERVYLCYPSCDNEGKPTIPSLFISDVEDLFEEKTVESRDRSISDIVFAPEETPTAGQAVLSLAEWAREQPPAARRALAAADPAGLGSRLDECLNPDNAGRRGIRDPRILARLCEQATFSITGLQKYLRCPFRYFISQILAPADLKPLAHALHRGQAVHRILCRFGAQLKRSGIYLGGDGVSKQQLDEIRRQMKGLIEEEFAEAGHDLEAQIMKSELTSCLDRYIDMELASGRRFTYHDFEVSFGEPMRECGGRNSSQDTISFADFSLKGRLDRIDIDGDSDRAMVIDYKFGSIPEGAEKFGENNEIQIPLYIRALKDIFGLTPIGGEYLSLRGQARRGIYLEGYEELAGSGSGQINSKDFVDSAAFSACLGAAEELAVAAVAGIRAGSFPIAEVDKKNDCKWCELTGICRRQGVETGPAGEGG